MEYEKKKKEFFFFKAFALSRKDICVFSPNLFSLLQTYLCSLAKRVVGSDKNLM